METTMAAFLTEIGSVVTAIIGWVGSAVQVIMDNPLLLFTVGFLALGGAIGILGRLLSKN